MNHLDIFFLVLIGASILYSLIRGLVREIFSFLAIIFGFIGASYGYTYVAKWLSQWVHSEFIAILAAFLILLIAISLGISLMGRLLSGLVKKANLNWADRMGGAAFGFLKAVLLIAIFSLVLTAFLPSKSRILYDSKIAPVALTIARGLAVVAPERFQGLYMEKERALRKYWASRELAEEKTESRAEKKR
jgi:membrane protein required for colicin V production